MSRGMSYSLPEALNRIEELEQRVEALEILLESLRNKSPYFIPTPSPQPYQPWGPQPYEKWYCTGTITHSAEFRK